jgi:hypothetical protein
VESSVHRLLPQNNYSYVQEENLDSTRNCVENYLLFTCITNQINALLYTGRVWASVLLLFCVLGHICVSLYEDYAQLQ